MNNFDKIATIGYSGKSFGIGALRAITELLAGENKEFAPPTDEEIKSIGIVVEKKEEDIEAFIEKHFLSPDWNKKVDHMNYPLDRFGDLDLMKKMVDYTPYIPKPSKKAWQSQSTSKFIPKTNKQR